jgi:N,N-dimethylformamidase
LLSSQEFTADLHLVDWLNVKDIEVDVITDEDLHRDGVDRLREYRVILTGTHPEYVTERMLDSLEQYLDGGGRLMYLGGNGYYWPIGVDPERPHVIEVRRGQNGTGTWRSAPGENHLSTTGEPGGLWRDRARAPQRLVGVGMAGAGFDRGGWFERTPESDDPRVAFIFEGVSRNARIGETGIGPTGTGGAVGIEIDRADPRLGTPPHALVIATSHGLSRSFQRAVEEVEFTDDKQGAPDCPFVRADMVFFECPNGGAVFSVGSMTWCSCLSANGYHNDVSRITENVLRAFAKDKISSP